jgi:hypothetical protein
MGKIFYYYYVNTKKIKQLCALIIIYKHALKSY